MFPALFLIACVLLIYFTDHSNENAFTMRLVCAFVAVTGAGVLAWEAHEAMMMTKSMYMLGTHTEMVQQSHYGMRFEANEWILK